MTWYLEMKEKDPTRDVWFLRNNKRAFIVGDITGIHYNKATGQNIGFDFKIKKGSMDTKKRYKIKDALRKYFYPEDIWRGWKG